MNQARNQEFWAKYKKRTLDAFHNGVLLNEKFIYE